VLELQNRVEAFTVENLLQDEEFVSATMQTTAGAIKTH
jgi:hypothetical protein